MSEKRNAASSRARFLIKLSKLSCVIPNSLTITNKWKNLSASAKEIYRVLVSKYNYEEGQSRVSQQEIQSIAGGGSRVTVVKAIKQLKDEGIIKILEIKTKNQLTKYHYLLPHQEKMYAMIGKTPERDFETIYSGSGNISKAEKTTILPESIDRNFYKVCEKMIILGIENPHKYIANYANDSESLKALLFMCDATYTIKKYNIPIENTNLSPLEFFIRKIGEGDIREDIFGSGATSRVKEEFKKRATFRKVDG